MTVSDLIMVLGRLPQDAEVVLPAYESGWDPVRHAILAGDAYDQTPRAYEGDIWLRPEYSRVLDTDADLAASGRTPRAPVVVLTSDPDGEICR